MDKQEILVALNGAFETLEELFNSNLEKMGELTERIEALKDHNKTLTQKMREVSNKIKELKN